ncbi:phosphatase PAP2 family protein [Fuerstiella marisgermanici]|uniref:PAP2 superfamily protein n=1 Tax=Fuerstiella marisgermanici TaxID=1891926 RepID=A0A1P8WJU9_9PLAN|nr:phosphatase PAP2 family protein [Fuerstiella marisgermanici]APZ94342.1 PAP2 superfamily protein [Fuerstiella marisgermanici]
MSSVSISSATRTLPVSRDAAFKGVLILATFVFDVVLIASLGLWFPLDDLIRPLLTATVLSGVGLWYLRRQEHGFVMCLLSLTQLVLFTSAYTVLMYAVAAVNMPLVDPYLAGFDQMLGIRVDRIAEWTARIPMLSVPLGIAYDTVMLQTAAAVVVLGFANRRRELEGFVLQFMLTTLTCAVLFVLLPADGPFITYDYAPNEAQQRFLHDFHEMRSQQRTLVTWRDAEGLITCPSFHTTWAILLAWAFRGVRYARWPMLLLNVLVVASTMTTGWHYFSDVVSGALLAVVGIVVVNRLQPWLYDEDNRPRPMSV